MENEENKQQNLKIIDQVLEEIWSGALQCPHSDLKIFTKEFCNSFVFKKGCIFKKGCELYPNLPDKEE